MHIDHATLTELLDYNAETGIFTWKPRDSRDKRWFKKEWHGRAWNTRYAGQPVRVIDRYRVCPDGTRALIRLEMEVLGRKYITHRLAWFWVHGRWPKKTIAHKNGNPADNRLANLREATQAQQTQNRRVQPRNPTGRKGVFYYPGCRTRPYVAKVGHNGRQITVGWFADPDEAHAAYLAKAKELHGEFFNPGRSA